MIQQVFWKPCLLNLISGSASRMFIKSLDKPHNSTSVLEALPVKLYSESALRMFIKSLGMPHNSTSVLEALPVKLDIRIVFENVF